MRKRRSKGSPTLSDVAKLAGVGPITVSRALRQPEKVSKKLRDAVDSAVRQLNYLPNLNARALASRRTDVVAVLVPSLTQNIFSDVLRGIYDGLDGSGLRIEVANTRYDPIAEENLIAGIVRHRPAAVIVSGVEQTTDARKMLENAGCPVVQIMDLTDDPIQKVIGFSHLHAGQAMAGHLHDMGYRRIGFIAGWMNSRSHQRFDGFRMVLEREGLFDPDLVGKMSNNGASPDRGPHGDGQLYATAEVGRQLMLDLLDRCPTIDAVFCNNDVLALGALFACNARALAVPHRIGIAGFNDFDYMAAAHPPLTSVRIHRWRCGNEAMRAVRRQLDDGDMGESIVDLGFEVVKRRSTDRRDLQFSPFPTGSARSDIDG